MTLPTNPDPHATQDSEYVLFGVTLFKKCVDQFKAACREKRYTLREFTFSASQVRAIVMK